MPPQHVQPISRIESWPTANQNELKVTEYILCPFAQALQDFVDDELSKLDDKKCRFTIEVLQVARQLKDSKKPIEDSPLSATALMKCIADLEAKQKQSSTIRKLSTKLDPVVQGLSQYISVVDTMIQADPTPGALIYGGAKLVLQLASGFSDCFGRVVGAMIEIGIRLELFNKYYIAYGWSDGMRSALVKSYKGVLRFWRNAARLFTRRGIKTVFRSLFKPFNAEYEPLLKALEEDTQRVRDEAHAAQGIASKKHEDECSKDRVVSNREKIIDWVDNGVDSEADYKRFSYLKHPGTCEWLLAHEAFTNWKASRNSEVLWLNAAPGAGKSVLCSKVIEQMRSDKLKVVHFFFTFDEPAKSKYLAMLRSLIVQLLALLPYIPDGFTNIQKSARMSGRRTLDNLELAEKLLGTLLDCISRVHIVIDGLDERSEEEGSHKLPKHLQSLQRLQGLFEKKRGGVVKWFFASRDEADIRDIFTSVSRIEVGDSSKPDIEKFLQEEEDQFIEEDDDPQYATLAELSRGNFLWAKLTIDVIRGDGMTCEEDIEEALANFLPGLTSCYLRTLKQLTTKRSIREQELARRIFMFVTLAPQPLTFNELSEALAVRVGTFQPDERQTPRATIIENLCCPLIELDRTKSKINPTLRLAHKTIGDFLRQDPEQLDSIPKECWKFFVNNDNANLDIGMICLTYLSYTRYINPVDLEIELKLDPLKVHAFLPYAAIFWHEHLSNIKGTQALFDHVSRFLRSCNFWTCMRVQSIYAPYLFARLTICGDGYFVMNSPTEVARHDCHDYYSDALPEWLTEFGSEGNFLVRSYMMFVKEWGLALLRYPGEIGRCLPATLGSNNFLSTFECSSKDEIILSLEGTFNGDLLYASDDIPSKAAITRVVSFLPTDTGLHATAISFTSYTETTQVTLHQWLFDPSVVDTADICPPKQLEFSTSDLARSLTTQPSINPRLLSPTPFQPSSFKADPAFIVTTGPGILPIGGTPSELYRICLNSKSIARISSKAPEVVIRRKGYSLTSRQITAQGSKIASAFRISPPNDSRDPPRSRHSSFVDSDYGTDTEESSEDESPPTTHVIGVFGSENDENPSWHKFEDDESVLRQSPPVFHPTRSLVVWPRNKSSLLFFNYKTGLTKVINTERERSIVSRDLHFSSSGNLIHEASVRTETVRGVITWTVERTTSEISIEDDNPATAKVARGRFSESTVSWSSGASGAYDAADSQKLPCSFTWTENHLYVAFGAFEMNVCRLSLPTGSITNLDWKPTIETLNPMILPASTDERGVRFFPYTVGDISYGIFALGGTPEMPPVIISRNVNQLGGWKSFEGRGIIALKSERVDGYMKGVYSAGEESYSVPIRSSLAWNKRTYVTCY